MTSITTFSKGFPGELGAVFRFFLCLCAIWVVLRLVIAACRRRRVRYPPGPSGLPVLGVAGIHPKSEFWKTYARWGTEYGKHGLISFHVLGRRIVVINSVTVARDLLVKRGAIYSDRPFPTMAARIMRRGKSLFYSKFGPRVRNSRRLFDLSFNMNASKSYWGVLEHEARLLVDRVIQQPEDFLRHIQLNSASVIMRIAYGHQVKSDQDRFFILAERSMYIASAASAPGRWLVDSFPILRFLPSFLPGAGFKRQAKAWRDELSVHRTEPFEYAKAQVQKGLHVQSFTSQFLCPENPTAVDEDTLSWAASALYAAGADTTASAIRTFIYQMAQNPTIQARAKSELNSLLSSSLPSSSPIRLPSISDRPSLPYLNAILKETLRWCPPAPMGLPHCTSSHDVYRSYDIPSGTVVIPNIWAMLHDEDVYPDAMRFDPERFVGEVEGQQRDPLPLVFGLGKRTCPGRYVAEASVFVQMAMILATLDVSWKGDGSGKGERFTTGIVSYLEPFECSITPRKDGCVALLREDVAGESDGL